ncbi:glycosyltransferase family 4 protein [Candidatus Woesearchaeota archaeon]|nr:glycosyltransferase family 4 protein [Candidatus Woesearchaeota archaeon]
MRILVATDNYLPRWDGISRFLHEILPGLARNFDISVIGPGFPGKSMGIRGVSAELLPTFGFHVGDYSPAKPSMRKIREMVEDCDVVFSQSLGPIGFFAVNYAKRYGKPLVCYVHSIEWELFEKSIKLHRYAKSIVKHTTKSLARSLYNKADLLLVPSKEIGSLLTKEGIRTKKHVVHLGINTEEFRPSAKKADAKKKLSFGDDIIIGFTGRLGREKDLPTLYEAFDIISRVHDDVRLVIVGTGIEELGSRTNKRVIFTGNVDNVQDYLRAFDIFVMPSLTETSSLATMEAMACALPVVSTKVGYIRHYIRDGQNGFFFDFGDANGLARRLDMLIGSESLRRSIGKKARETIVRKYPWSKTMKELNMVFDGFRP